MAWTTQVADLQELQQDALDTATLAWNEATVTGKLLPRLPGKTITLPVLGKVEYYDTATLMRNLQNRNRRLKYPWLMWCDGRTWVITHAQDHNSTYANITNTLYVRAAKIGQQAVTRRISTDTLLLQFTKRVEQPAERCDNQECGGHCSACYAALVQESVTA